MATHETIDENPHTRGIASFVSGLRYEEIPGEVRNRIKLLILYWMRALRIAAPLEQDRRGDAPTPGHLLGLHSVGDIRETLGTACRPGKRDHGPGL